MEFKHKICLYEAEGNNRLSSFYNHNLKYFNFDSRLVNGSVRVLFKDMSENKADIVVLNLLGFDNEKIKYVINNNHMIE